MVYLAAFGRIASPAPQAARNRIQGRCVEPDVLRAATAMTLLLAAGCSSQNGAACPQFVPASGLTVSATAFAAAHRQARTLRVCASMSAQCDGGISERLRPRIPASIFLKLTPGSRPLHVRVVVEGPAGTVLLNQAAIVTLHHVVDAACPDISSYRASATVSRQGAIRMR
jgi:hypothetical protein